MKIKKMTASFGTLTGSELSFGGGLNIIYAPNESGKSTWCAFIRAMLYGIDSAERERAGIKPDKLKFAPWSGKPMEGSIDLEHRGQDVTIRRWTKSAAAPMREFSAVYTGTDSTYPIRGNAAGEELTGVPKSVFERSAFISQSGIFICGSPELEKRVASIVSTGEEDTSFTEADERLRAWQRRRRHNKYGRLPELEGEIEALGRRLGELKQAASEKSRLFEQLSLAQERYENTRIMAQEDRKRRHESALERVSAVREEILEKEKKYADASLSRQGRRIELAKSVLGEICPEEASVSAQADLARYEELLKAKYAKKTAVFWILSFILAVVSAVLGIAAVRWMLYPGAVFLILGAVLCYSGFAGRKKATAAAETGLKEILLKYRAADRNGIIETVSEHRRIFGFWQEALRAESAAAAMLEEARDSLSRLDNELFSELDEKESGGAYTHAGLADAEKNLSRLREEWAMASGRLDALGDPLIIETELENLKEQHNELSAQYDAIALATQTLRESSVEIQSRFSPQLGRRATELMAYLTNGKYDELTFDRELSPKARKSGDAIGRETAFLSEGATDQLYFALRLAICELALPSEDPCPLILDDALVNFDDYRIARALDLLRELGKNRQILLFTCHTREFEYFKGAAGVMTIDLCTIQ